VAERTYGLSIEERLARNRVAGRCVIDQ